MGCAASSSSPSPNQAAFEAQKEIVKFRYGTANMDIFGTDVDKTLIRTRNAFECGKSTIFLMTMPVSKPQAESYPTDGATPEAPPATEAAPAPAAEDANAGAATTDGAPADAPAEAPAAAPAEPPKPSIRWAIYNDGKAEAKVTCTFFHAEEVKVLGGAQAKENRMEGGRLQVELTVPGTKTVAFVEGPIGGYMWKCMVKNPEGNFDLARTYEEKNYDP